MISLKEFYSKKYLAGIIFLIPCFIWAQTQGQKTKEIDSLILNETKRLRNEAKYEEIIPFSEKIIQQSKEIKYLKGEALGYIKLGNAYCTLGDYKKSSSALNKAKELSQSIDDFSLKASIAIETGRNYNESGVSVKEAITQFKEAEKLASKIPEKDQRETYLMYAYQNLLSAYTNIKRTDIAIYYAWKAKNIEEDAYVLSYLTYYYIQQNKNNDSIVYYLNRSLSFFDKNPTYTFEKTIVYNQWGKYYEDRKHYKQAVEAYHKAEKYGKESKALDEILKAFNGLSRCYEALNNYEKTIKYERKFSRLQDSITVAKNKNVSNTVDNIVQNKEKGFLQQLSRLQKILAIILFVFLCIAIYFLLKLKKQNNDKIKMDKLLHEKENKIAQHAEETHQLKLKVNESFEEVIYLAKTNSPEFWAKFQEVYPNFREKLLKVNSQIRSSELTFCAYLFLGFSTKEIAEYTFKAVKTVENNRYNIRKKLDLSSEKDLLVWLREYIDSE